MKLALHDKQSVSNPPLQVAHKLLQLVHWLSVKFKNWLAAHGLKHFPFTPSIYGYFDCVATAHIKQSVSKGPTQALHVVWQALQSLVVGSLYVDGYNA